MMKKPIYTVVRIAVLLASLTASQATESETPVAEPGRMPGFTWDTVPLYVHIRKDTAFTDEEIDHLATFPLITFEKATGHSDFGSVDAGTLQAAQAVKAVNPATKILYYRNVIVHYGGYTANESIKNIPGAFLVGRYGNHRLIRNRLRAYSYFYLKDGYDAKKSNTWLTRRADYDRPLGPPKGLAIRDGYTYTREFAHASVQLDIENETASIAWKPQEQD